ncbi:thiamine pyrophosphate-dependent enzyme [Streptomyces sp. NPDC085540]|uniref:thiamine pyrophosphate-dependent enzyme n=1 Tax=Streptomyces sp. NPDC085540 TaxID=3365730 RepID=UPI0037D0FCE0
MRRRGSGGRIVVSAGHVQGAAGALSFPPRTTSGARSPDRNRQVVSMAGDGGSSMLWGDFLPLVQYDLPVKMVLFDNSPCRKPEWKESVSGLSSYGTTDQAPDVAALGRGVGAYEGGSAKPEQLTGALEGAFRQR